MIVVSFFPKFHNVDDRDKEIAKYSQWLDKYGDYGRLYMWDIYKMKGAMTATINGVKIFDDEVATLFKLSLEV